MRINTGLVSSKCVVPLNLVSGLIPRQLVVESLCIEP